MSSLPPRLAATALRLLLPMALRDDALDELADGHALRVARDGRRAANRWYWRQVPGFALRVSRRASARFGPSRYATLANACS